MTQKYGRNFGLVWFGYELNKKNRRINVSIIIQIMKKKNTSGLYVREFLFRAILLSAKIINC